MTWVASFQRVNLDPQTRVDFPVFCKKIAGFLRAGKSILPQEAATVMHEDNYACNTMGNA